MAPPNPAAAIGPTPGATVRETSRGMVWMLRVASALVFVVGIQLFVLAEHTDRYFAFTIKPSITAAFLGANYWAAFALEFLGARERVWVRARTAVPGVLLFTALTEIATLAHLRYFDTDLFIAGHFRIRALAVWAWILVYLTVPIVMGVLLARQANAPGENPPRDRPLPPALRALLALQAVAMVVVGALLVVGHPAAVRWWPWSLLSGDAAYVSPMWWYVGVWLVGIGAVGVQIVGENDRARTRGAMASYLVLAVLQGVVLLRYGRALDWHATRTWVFASFVASIGVAAGAGWIAARPAGIGQGGNQASPPV